jgi:hypothetical protein
MLSMEVQLSFRRDHPEAWIMKLTDTVEYLEGELAHRRGLNTRDNPYRFRSAQHWRWQEGLLGTSRPNAF